MKKALVTALLLASSSIAMAKPVTYSASASVSISAGTHTGGGRQDLRDHRSTYTPPAKAPAVAPRLKVKPVYLQQLRPAVWNPNNTTLGVNASTYIGPRPVLQQPCVAHASGWQVATWHPMTEPTRIDRGRELFNFGAQAGSFRQIQLVETAGSSHISQVAIEFVGGGRTQVVKLDTDLKAGRSLTIDLDGGVRQINRIIVYGSTAQSSAYQIFGR
ncbi:MAG: hypothetical protein KIT31_37360 [Deltaproteobacteria bacterium]|nr:hypothetical protein [Deltaproteobacteria bacterium]